MELRVKHGGKYRINENFAEVLYVEMVNNGEGKFNGIVSYVSGTSRPVDSSYIWDVDGRCYQGHTCMIDYQLLEEYSSKIRRFCMVSTCQCSKPMSVNISFSENPDHAHYVCKLCDKDIK